MPELDTSIRRLLEDRAAAVADPVGPPPGVMRRARMRRLRTGSGAGLLAAALLLGSSVALGRSSGDKTTTDLATQPPTTVEATEPTAPVTTTAAVTPSTTVPATAPTTGVGPTSIVDVPTKPGGGASELPGEPSDTGPAAGDVLGVVGVSHDDVLNVRALPGNGHRVVATLSPVASDVEATGRHRYLAGTPGSFWWEIRVDGVAGWVNARFLAWLGEINDTTAEIITLLGRRPAAGTMEQLGRIVAESQAAPDSEGGTRITLTVAPTRGDLGEVTYDVIGFPDDSVTGVRLHVFGEPSGNGFVLRTVESTTLCARGATGGRLCL